MQSIKSEEMITKDAVSYPSKMKNVLDHLEKAEWVLGAHKVRPDVLTEPEVDDLLRIVRASRCWLDYQF